MNFSDPVSYWRLISHIAGHQDWVHLMSNFSFILLIGPILEEKYGSRRLLQMILFTALITGILNVIFFSTGLMGASGIVFMFIILSSFTNFRSGDVPLTFILIILLFLTKEVISKSAKECRAMKCPTDELPMITAWGGKQCRCVRDPQKHAKYYTGTWLMNHDGWASGRVHFSIGYTF